MIRCMSCSILLLAVSLFGAASVNARSARETASRARKEVEALNREEAQSCAQMDNARTLTLWADDGVDLIQGLRPIVGKAAIAGWYASLTPQLRGPRIEFCRIDWRAITIRGDFAYEWGISRQKIDFPASRKAVESTGKILFILKRQRGGAWRIELESWSSSPAR